MPTTRQNKVSRLLQKELGSIFQRDSATWYKGAMITVTQARVSPDLGSAKIYVSIFSPKENRDEIYRLINERSKETRKKLGDTVKNQLRTVPQLSYFIDDSLDYFEKIDNLLKK